MRHLVLLLLSLAAVIAYAQRNAISIPAKTIQRDLQIDDAEMGFVFGAWYWGYAIAQLPAGWLADWRGSRACLIALAVLWSACTALVGFSFNFLSILVIWTAMGIAQAGLFPAATKTIGAWYPPRQHAFASSVLITGQTLGFALAPVIVTSLLIGNDWRTTFILCALPGLGWAMLYGLFTPAVAEPRSQSLGFASAFDRMIRSPSMWLLCAQQFLRSAAMVFFFTWFPRYLQEAHGVSATQSGWLSALPGITGMAGAALGGIASDWLLRRTGNPRWSRQGIAVLGMLGCAGLTFAAFFIREPVLAVLLISAGTFCGLFGGVSGYSVAIAFGGTRVATVFGTMNMCGNFGSALFPIAIGFLVKSSGNWNLALLLFSALFALDALLWALLNPRRPLFEDTHANR